MSANRICFVQQYSWVVYHYFVTDLIYRASASDFADPYLQHWSPRKPVNSLESGLGLVKTDRFVEMARLPRPSGEGRGNLAISTNLSVLTNPSPDSRLLTGFRGDQCCR